MKVAYIYPEELPSMKARTISVINTFVELSKLCDTTLFTSSESANLKTIKDHYNFDNQVKIKFIYKKFLGLKSNKFFNRNLLKEMTKEKIDVYYVRHLKTAEFLIKHKPENQKIIFECHEIFYKNMQKDSPNNDKKIAILKNMEEFIYQNCDGLTFVNKTLQIYFNETFKNIQSNQAIAYNGMNFGDKYIKKDFTDLNKIYYIGNFFKSKGIEDAIKTIPHLDHISLQIVGGDSDQRINELENLIQKLNIEDKINFLGFKKTKEVKNILQNNAKITIIPNTKALRNKFSMPIKLYEYMATSNIVIAANMETIQEIIIDGENGFLFESGNLESLKDTIQKVISLPNETLQKIAKNAYETSKEFTWEKRAQNILSFAKDVLSS